MRATDRIAAAARAARAVASKSAGATRAARGAAPRSTGATRAGRGVLATGARVARGVAAAVGGPTGRRLARAATLMVALAVLVVTLYDRGEVPTAAAQTTVGAPGAAAGTAAGGRGGATRRQDPGEHGGLRGRTRPAPVGERPAEVAAAWYAARHGLPRAKVKALQQDRLSAREVRVLVLADPGRGRLRTALVRVRRGPDGWSVR